MKHLIHRLMEASLPESWEKFFEELDDRLNRKFTFTEKFRIKDFGGDDRKGAMTLVINIEVPEGEYGDHVDVSYFIEWHVKDREIEIELTWDVPELNRLDTGDVDKDFPLRPGVHKKVNAWLADEIDDALDEILDELGNLA